MDPETTSYVDAERDIVMAESVLDAAQDAERAKEAVKYPECAKLAAAMDDARVITEFLEFLLGEKDLTLCELGEASLRYHRVDTSDKAIERLLAEYFEIDLAKVESEQRAALAELGALPPFEPKPIKFWTE